jgi:hypothetical protein
MSTTVPKSFWVIAVLAFVWNLMGVMAYIMQVNMTPEVIALLPEAEQALYANVPAWATGAFAIAVFGGLLGSLLLLFRKRLAISVFILSLIGVIVQMAYNIFLSKSIEVYGPGGMIMPVMVIVIAVALVWYARKASSRNWLS